MVVISKVVELALDGLDQAEGFFRGPPGGNDRTAKKERDALVQMATTSLNRVQPQGKASCKEDSS